MAIRYIVPDIIAAQLVPPSEGPLVLELKNEDEDRLLLTIRDYRYDPDGLKLFAQCTNDGFGEHPAMKHMVVRVPMRDLIGFVATWQTVDQTTDTEGSDDVIEAEFGGALPS
jgi:hypothetical protein